MEFLFSRTVGQARAKAYIGKSIENKAFPQALLTYGEKGLGQHALITDITDILLCVSGDIRPCGQCPRCLEQLSHSRDNVSTLFPLSETNRKTRDARSKNIMKKKESILETPYRLTRTVREHISIDQVRDLRERFVFSEVVSRNRVVVIYLAETMQAPAANALLKILEEPPANTYFLLSCENRELLLPTILSRCVGLSLSRLTEVEMAGFAKTHNPKQDDGGYESLVPLCGGSPGRYLEMAEEEGVLLLQLAHAYLQCLLQRDWQSLSRLIDNRKPFRETDACLRILLLALETIRISTFPRYNGLAVSDALSNGESAALVSRLAALDDIEPYINYIQDCIEGVSRYCRPQVSLLGNFFKLAEQL